MLKQRMQKKADFTENNNLNLEDEKSHDFNVKLLAKQEIKEQRHGGFQCLHCNSFVPINLTMGTSHRNHCNRCLWSKHVDKKTSGDRLSDCQAGMIPIGITLKKEGTDKYGKEKLGDVMLVHQCTGCGEYSINRIAADDSIDSIMIIFDESQNLPKKTKDELSIKGIVLVSPENRKLVEERLLGKR